MNKIVFATGNRGKLREAKEIFKGYEILSIFDFTDSFNPEECGDTFLQNCVIKAEAARKIVQDYPVLADDSGLVVPALDGAPGVYSARYGGEDGNDKLNREKLLLEMSSIGNRGAFFSCTAVFLTADYSALVSEGRCYGSIGFKEKGDRGFGYDPLFIPVGQNLTLAEFTSEDKNRISHRGEAFSKLERNFKCFLD